jgi:phosphoglycolate phosphatase-like HAD superfamily hydrolase
MRPFNEYGVIIFDCDGVILDSNTLKIDAMRNALKESAITSVEVDECTSFFSDNFGKSRFYHIDYFVDNLLGIERAAIDNFKRNLLASYSKQCKSLYLFAKKTPFITELLTQTSAIKYVASGSEQQELRDVFLTRKLHYYFKEILGSPEKKVNHVTHILAKNVALKAVMIGDAISDLEAAKKNNIDFIFYRPLSNVEEKMSELCLQFGYRIIDSFEEVLKEL